MAEWPKAPIIGRRAIVSEVQILLRPPPCRSVPAIAILGVTPVKTPMTAASANGRALGYMAVEIDVQMKTFAVAAGVDLELRRFGDDELDVVVAALA